MLAKKAEEHRPSTARPHPPTPQKCLLTCTWRLWLLTRLAVPVGCRTAASEPRPRKSALGRLLDWPATSQLDPQCSCMAPSTADSLIAPCWAATLQLLGTQSFGLFAIFGAVAFSGLPQRSHSALQVTTAYPEQPGLICCLHNSPAHLQPLR